MQARGSGQDAQRPPEQTFGLIHFTQVPTSDRQTLQGLGDLGVILSEARLLNGQGFEKQSEGVVVSALGEVQVSDVSETLGDVGMRRRQKLLPGLENPLEQRRRLGDEAQPQVDRAESGTQAGADERLVGESGLGSFEAELEKVHHRHRAALGSRRVGGAEQVDQELGDLVRRLGLEVGAGGLAPGALRLDPGPAGGDGGGGEAGEYRQQNQRSRREAEPVPAYGLAESITKGARMRCDGLAGLETLEVGGQLGGRLVTLLAIDGQGLEHDRVEVAAHPPDESADPEPTSSGDFASSCHRGRRDAQKAEPGWRRRPLAPCRPEASPRRGAGRAPCRGRRRRIVCRHARPE